MEEYYNTTNDYTRKRTYSADCRLLARSQGWRWFRPADRRALPGRIIRRPEYGIHMPGTI